VSDLDERGHGLRDGAVLLDVCGRGHLHSGQHVVELVAAAARRLATSRARSLVAGQVALGLGAAGGLAARPRALGGGASGLAVGHGGSADGLALGGETDVLAQGAAASLTVLAGAAHLALGLLTADVAGGLGKLLASQLASRLLALGLAVGGAGRGVALPLAVREARALGRSSDLLEPSSVGESHVLSSGTSNQESESEEESHLSV